MSDTVATTTITTMCSKGNKEMATDHAFATTPAAPASTAPGTDNSNSADEKISIILEFDDFIDLQTRLVLLPYIEDEGQGAVIMTYQQHSQQQQEYHHDNDVQGMVLTRIQGQEQEPNDIENDFSKIDFTEILASIRNQSPPIRLVFERMMNENAHNVQIEVQDGGDIQQSIDHEQNHHQHNQYAQHEEKKDELYDCHSKKPLQATAVGVVASPVKRQPINSALDDHIPNNNNNYSNNNKSLSHSMLALSAWGLRMKAQSEKLAADAMATINANNNHHNKNETASSRNQISSLQLDGTNSTNINNDNNVDITLTPPCGMYLQTNLGAYFAISGTVQKSIHHPVTTSSLLCIRKSATEPLVSYHQQSTSLGTSTHFSFQWYHSTSHKTQYRAPHSVTSWYPNNNDAPSIASKSTLHSGNSTTSCNTASASTSTSSASDHDWVELKGAIHATFQPNTTLVGRKLRCVVTITQRPVLGISTSLTSSQEENQDTQLHTKYHSQDTTTNTINKDERLYTISLADQEEDDGNQKVVTQEIVCDLLLPVQADTILFNGARQAMLRGTKFGNMIKRINAVQDDIEDDGGSDPHQKPAVVFRVEVAMARKITIKTQKTVNVNAVHISKICPQTDDYIPLTDQPLLQVTARVDTNHARHVDLIFTTIPSSTRRHHPDDDENAYTTSQFLKEYCVPDQHSLSQNTLKLELEAPNRLTRESLLLALGIANYQGNQNLLDDKTVLFRDEVPPLPTKVIETPKNKSTTSSSINNNNRSNPSSPRGLTVSQLPPKQLSSVTSSKDDDSLSTASDSDGEAVCANLPNSPPRHSTLTVTQPSPSGFFSCQSSLPENGLVFVPPPVATDAATAVDTVQALAWQREVEFLRSELSRKDRNITDLQRQVQRSESTLQKTKQAWHGTEQELKQAMQDCERIQISKRQIEHCLQEQHETMQKAETIHKQQILQLEQTMQHRAEHIVDLEKANRALQNEKAVLTAAVEARESKLVRMGELQEANQKLSQDMTHNKALQAKLEQSEKQREALQQELMAMTEAQGTLRTELDVAMRKIENLQRRLEGEQTKASSHQVQLDSLLKMNQQLKGERNNYRQKNESLSKEISRLCRDGRTIRDIEKFVADHNAVVQEVDLLRVQKRKALEDAHQYRTLYEQIKASEQVLGVEEDTLRAVERCTELERVLTEMTDYVHAKEMQLETMKQVNEALQQEIHNLAKAHRQKNEV
jgi:hypothetical protein